MEYFGRRMIIAEKSHVANRSPITVLENTRVMTCTGFASGRTGESASELANRTVPIFLTWIHLPRRSHQLWLSVSFTFRCSSIISGREYRKCRREGVIKFLHGKATDTRHTNSVSAREFAIRIQNALLGDRVTFRRTSSGYYLIFLHRMLNKENDIRMHPVQIKFWIQPKSAADVHIILTEL